MSKRPVRKSQQFLEKSQQFLESTSRFFLSIAELSEVGLRHDLEREANLNSTNFPSQGGVLRKAYER